MIQLLNIDEILEATKKELQIYKFVKVDGTYRFIQLAMYGSNHCDLVDEGEVAQAAGTIFLGPDYWRINDWYSSTLSLGCGGEEERELQTLINRTPHAEIVMRKYEEGLKRG